MNMIAKFISDFDSFLWGPPLLILLVGVHIFLTVRLKFIQRYIPLGIKLSVKKDAAAAGDISQFGALAIALAATIGTGNIIGVATAVVLGGPGAVFWCWLCGVFGIATKYGEAVLAVKYRVVEKDGMICGGPMYAMERGMNNKFLAVLFAIFTLGACTGIGSMTQSNAVASFAQEVFSIPCWLSGGLETLLIIAVVVGGVKVVSKVCGALVPFMAVLYVGCCLAIMIMNGAYIVPALALIVKSAFSTEAVSGGFFGSMIMLAMRYGIARGLFSNESGLGSAPLIAASAKTSNPVRQALISSTGTFWDTVCICALTGITLVSSVLKADPQADFSKFNAVELPKLAFAQLPAGHIFLGIALVVFAYTTILGWFCYGRQAIHYLGGKWSFQIFRVIFVFLVFFGAVIKLDVVWNISDIANGLMAIPNLICLAALSGVIVKETEKYLWSNKLDEPDPECIRINEAGKALSADGEVEEK